MITWLSSTTIRFTTNCNTFCCTGKEGSSIASRILVQNAPTPARSRSSAVLSPLLLDFSHPFPQHAPVVVKPATSLRQFGQVNFFGLIGINEPRHFSVEGGELALQAHPFLCRTDIDGGVPTPVLI